MEQRADSEMCCRVAKKLSLVVLIVFFVSGCGGGDSQSLYSQGPYLAQITNFTVTGNDNKVNGREQIVAGINNGSFSIYLYVDAVSAHTVSIVVSDRTDLFSTNLEQEIAHIENGYYPFYKFNILLNCNFSLANQISCQVVSAGGEKITATLPQTDISPMLNGNQADLYIVLVDSAPNLIPAQWNVPVTFRHN